MILDGAQYNCNFLINLSRPLENAAPSHSVGHYHYNFILLHRVSSSPLQTNKRGTELCRGDWKAKLGAWLK